MPPSKARVNFLGEKNGALCGPGCIHTKSGRGTDMSHKQLPYFCRVLTCRMFAPAPVCPNWNSFTGISQSKFETEGFKAAKEKTYLFSHSSWELKQFKTAAESVSISGNVRKYANIKQYCACDPVHANLQFEIG